MKIFRILFIILILTLSIFAFFNSAKFETNILKALLNDSQNSELIINLSNNFSSKINVLVEADNIDDCECISKEFLSKIDNQFFKIKSIDYQKGFSTYKEYNMSFLSDKTRNLLLRHDYDTVEKEAFERLINPIGISILPIEDDPFLLFTDYIMNLSASNSITAGNTIQYNGKYYIYNILQINSDVFSPSTVNEKIKELIKTSKDYSSIYLSGVPIHSYYASSASIIEINVICVISFFFLIGLFYFWFRNLKLLLPAFLSLIIAIAGGYGAAALIFSKIHILTFVFSTTLIGICIDYSLHYFMERNLSKILKSLTVSLLSTACAFCVLMFSGLELLKQISVFTIVGLFFVYLFIILFYPMICKNIFNNYERNIVVNIPYKKLILASAFIVSLIGLLTLNFNDDIKNMYVPSKELIKAEKLFADVTESNYKTAFIIVEGKNLEEILQKEETLSSEFENYQALSKYIPSKKRQLENIELHRKLYENSLDNYAEFLTKEQRDKLKKENNIKLIEFDNSSILSEFLTGNNKSVIVLYDEKVPDLTRVDDVYYIDLKSDISSKIKEYRESCIKLIIPILIVLFVILSAIYKNSLKALRIIFPSVLGACFSIGFVSLLYREVNMFHILSVFLIIGFGLDYSVFRSSGVKNSTGAVMLSCATSVFSFALLSFTSFKLISSLGVTLAIGLLTSYILSLLLIPESGLEENKDNI